MGDAVTADDDPTRTTTPSWTCPSCGAEGPGEPDECPFCPWQRTQQSAPADKCLFSGSKLIQEGRVVCPACQNPVKVHMVNGLWTLAPHDEMRVSL